LGTAFDVRHYPTDAEVQVAVTQGKVTVHGKTPSQVVTVVAGSVARVTDSTLTTAVVGDVRDYASWTTGRLVFRGTQVADMLTTVGAWYGYEFHLADSTLARMRVNADLQFSSSTVMFKALENLLGVHMTFDGRVVTLHPQQTPRQTPRTTRDLERSLSTSPEFGK
jgi:ferric-dicitrate binding protein FerR (iron transport regulator)